MTAPIVVIQRLIPHYRLSLFRRLHEEYGWMIATSETGPLQSFKIADHEAGFIRRFPFKFLRANDPFTCMVPLSDIVRELKPRAIVSEFGLRITSTYELIARRRFGGTPFMFWTHGSNTSRGEESLKDRVLQGTARLLLAQADGAVCYSEPGAKRMATVMPSNHVFVAHNTMDLAPLQADAARLGRQPAPGKPHLLSVGRMLTDKDFPMLIRAFKWFRNRHAPEAVLTLIGDGPDMLAVRAAANDDPAIRLLGSIYDEAILAREFMSADLFVYAGAVGLAANHAMAFGLPVMIFEQTPKGPFHSPEEVYVVNGVTGARVTPYSEEGLAQSLGDFFTTHPDPRSAFGDSIARFVDENITLERMVRDFAAVDAFLRSPIHTP